MPGVVRGAPHWGACRVPLFLATITPSCAIRVLRAAAGISVPAGMCKEHHSLVSAEVLPVGTAPTASCWQLLQEHLTPHGPSEPLASVTSLLPAHPEPQLHWSHPNWTSRLISCLVINYAVMPGRHCRFDMIRASHSCMFLLAAALSKACGRTWRTLKANQRC